MSETQASGGGPPTPAGGLPVSAGPVEGPGEKLTTSPLLFAYRGRDGRLAACDARAGTRFRLHSARAAELAMMFLDGGTGQAPAAAPTEAELAQARAAGIVIDDSDYQRLSIWERHGWSRAAYLTLTQMDIAYLEQPNALEDPSAVRGRRSAAIADYHSDDPYPEPQPLASGVAIDLPVPEAAAPRLSALTDRRSVRAFSATAPSAADLAGVLHAATESLRVLAHYRRSPQRSSLLNSFGSWAHLMIVVQDVHDISPGVYEYDWTAHRLVAHAPAPADEQLRACVQGQGWVLGAGFVVFLVADMRGYAWIYRHSRAYTHLIMQAGELSQELLMAATSRGLGGWTTPAVHESRTAALLHLPDDDALDAVSMTKLGRPASRRGQHP